MGLNFYSYDGRQHYVDSFVHHCENALNVVEMCGASQNAILWIRNFCDIFGDFCVASVFHIRAEIVQLEPIYSSIRVGLGSDDDFPSFALDHRVPSILEGKSYNISLPLQRCHFSDMRSLSLV